MSKKTIRTQEQIAKDIARLAKTCSMCKVDKPFKFFTKDYKSPDGFYFRCKKCMTSLIDKKKERERKLKSKYKIDNGVFTSLLEQQEGVCAICKKDEAGGPHAAFKVDHCHKTGKVRGLLCQHCNLGLGHFKDDETLLKAAIEYLNENRS